MKNIKTAKRYLMTLVLIALFSFSACESEKGFIRHQQSPALSTEEQAEQQPRRIKSEEEIISELRSLNKLEAKSYLIGPSDKFDFSVYNEPDLQLKGVIVRADGYITLNLIGDLKVEGLTIGQATELINQKYEKYLKSPKTSLIPYELSSGKFTILGKVNNPGSYSIEKELRLLDAIAMAGGLSIGIFKNSTVELADLEHSFIVRQHSILPVNFVRLIKKGDTLHNIPIHPGDYINIPSSRSQEVYVLGAVKTPDAYGYRENLTLTQIITYAQGTLSVSSEGHIRVIRGGLSDPKVFVVDLKKIKAGRLLDFKLEPGDIVFVPKTPLAKWNDVMEQVLPSIEALTLMKATFAPEDRTSTE